MTDLEKELALEAEMVGLGANRVWKEVLGGGTTVNGKAKKGLKEREEESRSLYGRKLIGYRMEPFVKAITEFCEATEAGKGHSAKAVLKQFSPKIAAFITLQSVVDSITKKKLHTRAAVLVGRNLEDEARFTHFEQTNKPFWDKLRGDLEGREPNMDRRRSILIHEMNKGAEMMREMAWPAWGDSKCLHVGAKCLELLETSTGMITTPVISTGPHSTVRILEATESTTSWVKQQMDDAGLIAPFYMPTIIPPRPWTCPTRGGYHLETLRPMPMVKVYGIRGKNYLEELANRVEEMPMVYASLNAVQSTPWKINRDILGVMSQIWKTGLEVGDMPSTEEIPLPPKPTDIEINEVTRRSWAREASEVYKARAQQKSRVVQMDRLLWVAEKYAPEDTLYFPMQLDFRGRMYAVPGFLNPQGNDPAKALLLFARGKKLTPGGMRWMKIQLANHWGEDKVGFDARVKWTEDHKDLIVKSVADPFEHREWMDADKPWQFLASAMDYVEALNDPEHVSYLPISVDGTCNGLQHFSAMLRDTKGAEAVNLVPSETPQDIYQRVADAVRSVLIDCDEQYAQDWLTWGFDRKATKRAVMIVPYSGTLFAARDYTLEYIKKKSKTSPCPWKEDKFQASLYFSKHVWTEIGNMIVSAGKAMRWLRAVAKAVTKAGSSLDWITPVGFPVKQDYRNLEAFRVETRLGNKTIYKPVLLRELESFDPRAQEQGVSPNFVHSLDAACLQMTVCRGLDDGIENFAMVHDSYGVLASDMDLLYVGLRDCFVDIYQNDVLADFYKTATSGLREDQLKKIPPMPPSGDFQLESVKESKYFFA